MWEILTPVAFALTVWWAATVIMMRRSLSAPPRCTVSLLAISLVAVLGGIALLATLQQATPLGAYLGFAGGMALWAWHELSYFLGFVTGPRPQACETGAGTGRRFSLGVQASLYHELAIVLTAALLWWLSADAPNQTGLWTFVLLWAMRWSAKLNIFLGVRNLHQEFWPEHLRYLESYVGKPGGNWLFPLSIGAAVAGLAWLLNIGLAASVSAFDRTGALLLATMLALAALEHVFLVLRVPDAWLWRLALEQPTDETPAPPVKWRTRPGS